MSLVLSIFGILYALAFGLAFLFAQAIFIAHLRGNAVRLGPEQLPDLYHRVQEIAARLGMKSAPVAYVLQEGGALNALATRFLRSDFIVLYSDLIDACGSNTEARDFIVAHELGHLKAGHLNARWFLMPGLVFPFLGTAYSRACEYTSDRYGLASARDPERALDGLTILAAGAKHGPLLNRRALVAQRSDLNTVWMKIGQWLSTHPTIAHRLAALQPSLATQPAGGRGAAIGAFAVLGGVIAVPVASMAALMAFTIYQATQEIQGRAEAALPDVAAGGLEDAAFSAQIEQEIQSLADAVEAHRSELGTLPESAEQMYATWTRLNPDTDEPHDPYTQERYGYAIEGARYTIWSAGKDTQFGSEDDLYYASQEPDADGEAEAGAQEDEPAEEEASAPEQS
jgi:Zn-dependent protease with chaperone function